MKWGWSEGLLSTGILGHILATVGTWMQEGGCISLWSLSPPVPSRSCSACLFLMDLSFLST